MPRGYRTSNQQKEAAIALAQTQLTQEEIAKQLGVSRRTLVRLWKKAGIGRHAKNSEKDNRIASKAGYRQQATIFDPLQMSRHREHSDYLRAQLELLSAHIRVPAPESVFLRPGLTDIGYPINELRTPFGNGLTARQNFYVHLHVNDGQIQASPQIERTEDWKFLCPHLLAEKTPPLMEDYAQWVQSLSLFFSLCHQASSQIVDEVDREINTRMKGVSGWQDVKVVSNRGERGLAKQFYIDVYSLGVSQQTHDKEECQVKAAEGQPGFAALWRSGCWLATGTPAEINAYREVHEVVRRKVPDWEQVRELLETYNDCRVRGQTLLTQLDIIIKRGTFEGTCDVCRPWYTGVIEEVTEHR